jgi:hypothetical protein
LPLHGKKLIVFFLARHPIALPSASRFNPHNIPGTVLPVPSNAFLAHRRGSPVPLISPLAAAPPA